MSFGTDSKMLIKNDKQVIRILKDRIIQRVENSWD